MTRFARIVAGLALAAWAGLVSAEKPLVLLRSDITEAYFAATAGSTTSCFRPGDSSSHGNISPRVRCAPPSLAP